MSASAVLEQAAVDIAVSALSAKVPAVLSALAEAKANAVTSDQAAAIDKAAADVTAAVSALTQVVP